MSTAAPIPADNWFARMQRGEVPPPPVAGLLGEVIRAVDVQAGTLQADYLADERFANPAGGVQGGMLGAMLDALTAGLVDATLQPGEVVATLSLNLQFMGPARPGALQGRAWLGKRGREVCFVHAELQQAGKVVAGAQAVCKILRAPG
jgi:uncharacterized protein (TIGR00369 family)